MSADQLRAFTLEHYVPTLTNYGYKIVTHDPGGIVFEWKRRPPVSIVGAIVLFPIGLLCLLYTETDQITFSFHHVSEGVSDLLVQGEGPKPLRRWLESALTPQPTAMS